jgi:hypothetical protein
VLGASLAADAEPPPAKDWEVEILTYGFLPDVDVSVENPSGGTEHYGLSVSDVLSHVQLAASGRANARWKRWLLLVDGFWVDLEDDDSVELDGLRLDADIELQMTLANALGGYRVFARPGGLLGKAAAGDERTFGIDLLAGANFTWLSTDVETERSAIGPIPERERDFGDSNSWFAPAVGLRLHNDFTPRIRLETLGVVGGFGVGDAPDLSWQLTTLLSYRFTDHWLASVGHRLIAAHDDDYDLRMHGVMLGVGYRL